jgi:hypothetical protein
MPGERLDRRRRAVVVVVSMETRHGLQVGL